MTRLTARWMFPGDGHPLENVVLECCDGRIVSVESGRQLPPDHASAPVAILPGLINLHTHLEFSLLPEPLEPRERFADWITSVIHWRRTSQNPLTAAVREGLLESQQAGVTALADIVTSDENPLAHDLSSSPYPGRLWLFRELLGSDAAAITEQLTSAQRFLDQPFPAGVQPGLSPHAPYSVHPDLLQGLTELARTRQVPLTMHLAESPAELELLQSGTGPLRELLEQLGAYRPELFARSRRPLEFLEQLNCGVPALVVHGNELAADELEYLAQAPQMTLVYCPRTHAGMQSSTHPWRRLLAAGGKVALGTDGRCSNPDLSIWRELQWLQARHRDLPASDLIRLATLHAARALDCPSRVGDSEQLPEQGRISVGAAANFCVVPLTAPGCTDPQRHLFDSRHQPAATIVRGLPVWESAPLSFSTMER